MKPFIFKLTLTIIPLIAVASLVVLSTDVSRKAARYQATIISHPQPGPEILGASYASVMNSLYTTSGR